MVRHMKQNERTSRTSSILGQLKGCVRVPLSGAPADHTKVMPSPKLATAPPWAHYLLATFKVLTLSLRGAHLVPILTFGHNYANTRPILLVQRPITFHLVSLERICNVPWCYSNHWPSYGGCYFSSTVCRHQVLCVKIPCKKNGYVWFVRRKLVKAPFST